MRWLVMLYQEAGGGAGGRERMLVQVGTPSPGDGAAHIQVKPQSHFQRCVSIDTKCSQIVSGDGASCLVFDMSSVLSPGVLLLKQAKDSLFFKKHNSNDYIVHLSHDHQKPGFSTILIGVCLHLPKKDLRLSKERVVGSLEHFQVEGPKLQRK